MTKKEKLQSQKDRIIELVNQIKEGDEFWFFIADKRVDQRPLVDIVGNTHPDTLSFVAAKSIKDLKDMQGSKMGKLRKLFTNKTVN